VCRCAAAGSWNFFESQAIKIGDDLHGATMAAANRVLFVVFAGVREQFDRGPAGAARSARRGTHAGLVAVRLPTAACADPEASNTALAEPIRPAPPEPAAAQLPTGVGALPFKDSHSVAAPPWRHPQLAVLNRPLAVAMAKVPKDRYWPIADFPADPNQVR
jgi:hypothetical protein